MLRNTVDSFGAVAKTFHWIVGLGIIGMLTVGYIMTSMAPSSLKMTLYGLHKSTGVVILLLVILRLSWRFMNPVPRLPSTLHPIHHHLARLSPIVLYILLFTVPLSGFVMSDAAGYPVTIYGLYTLPNIFAKNLELSKAARLVHIYGAYTFIGVLVMHVGAALFHHFVLKTNVLRRMLPSWIRFP